MDGRKKGILIAAGVVILVVLLYVFGIFPPTYTLTMQVDGGGTVSPAVGEYSHRSGVEISLNATPNTGYEFVSWNTSAGSIGNASRAQNQLTMPSSDAVVTARFRLLEFDARFENWDGELLTTVSVEHGSEPTPPEEPEREGYNFTGWNPPLAAVTADTTFVAEFEIRSYTVTFLDGTGEEMDIQTVEHGQMPIFPENPELEGHTFEGWNWSGNAVTSDLEISAEFEPIEYEITFLDWNGAVLDSQMVPFGTAASVPDLDEREGYTFIGWDGDPSEITGSMEFAAQYEINVYPVVFLDWDDTVLAEVMVEHGSDATAPEDPERFDHRFLGWDRTFDDIQAELAVRAEYEAVEHRVTFQEQADLPAVQIEIFADSAHEETVGQLESNDSGSVWLPLISGDYWYQAVAEGYEEWTGSFAVEAQPRTVIFVLTPKKGSIAGYVLDVENDEGIGRAGLTLYQGEGRSAQDMVGVAAADRDGMFRLREVVPGDYALRVNALGYEEPEEHAITVGPGEHVEDLEIVLERIIQEIASIELVDFGSDWLTFQVLDVDGMPYDGRVPWAVTLQEREGEALRDGAVGADYETEWQPNIDANGNATLRFEGLTTTAAPGTSQEITIETSDGSHSLSVVMELNVFGSVRER